MERATPASAGKLASHHWRDDLLADMLLSIRLRSAVYFPMELRAPWGFSLSGIGTAFHIVAFGPCWLEVAGVADPVELSGGDHVILPRGDAHVIRDSLTTRAADLVKCDGPDAPKGSRAGGDGPITQLLCGSLRLAHGA